MSQIIYNIIYQIIYNIIYQIIYNIIYQIIYNIIYQIIYNIIYQINSTIFPDICYAILISLLNFYVDIRVNIVFGTNFYLRCI